MSSYFDRMGTILQDKTGKELVKYIYVQYQWYFTEVTNNLNESELERISPIREEFWRIRELFDKGEVSPEQAVGLLHNLAHDLGKLRIILEDGRIAADNPWVPY